jgi:translocation and assembly module TamB
MRWRTITAGVAGTIVGAGLLLFAALQTVPGQRWLAETVSALASTGESRVELSGLSGFFPTDLRLERVEVADERGVWLRVEDARVRWSFASLFEGRLRVETAAARRLEVSRSPEPTKAPVAASDGGFSLPLGIALGDMSIADLHLGAAVGGGVASQWTVRGNALLSVSGAESRLRLTASRTDGPAGEIKADVRFDLARRTVDGEVSIDETTHGGVIAAALGRPDLERVSARLVAKGDAADGSVDLTVAAGDAVTANGDARWHRDGKDTAITARLTAAAPGLPDGPLARVLRGPISLVGDAILNDSSLVVRTIKLDLGPAELIASGRYELVSGKVDATATVDAAQAGAFADLLGGVTWRDLRLDVRAEGEVRSLRLTSKLAAREIAIPGLGDRVPGPVSLDATARVLVQRDQITVEAFDIETPLVSINAVGKVSSSGDDGEGKVAIALPDLGTFSTLAGRPLSGRGRLDLSAQRRAGIVRLDWQGALEDLGVPDLPHGLLGPAVALSGRAILRRGEDWQLSAIKVTGEGLSLEAEGRGRNEEGEIELSLKVPQLGVLGVEVTGGATLSGKAVRRSGRVDIRVAADLSDLGRLDIRSRKLSAVVETTIEGADVSGSVRAEGDLAGHPLTLSGRYTRNGDGEVAVPVLEGHWASATLDVAGFTVTTQGATGKAELKLSQLRDFASLIGADLSGALDLEITTDSNSAAGRVHTKLRGTDLKGDGFAVGTLKIDAVVDDPLGMAATEATISGDRLAGLADIVRFTGTLKGNRDKADVAMQASGSISNAAVAAKVDLAGGEVRIDLSRLEGRHGGLAMTLAAPAQLRVSGARVETKTVALRVGSGRVTVSGVLDPATSDLTVDVAALPLSLLEVVAPGNEFEGTLQAKLRVRGATSNPRIDATYNASGLRLRRADAVLLPSLALQGSASLVDRQAAIDARLTAGRATRVILKGKASLPAADAPVSATASITGAIEIAPFSPLIGNEIRNVTGVLRPSVTLDVAGSTVTGSGTIALDGAALTVPALGLRLTGGKAALTLQGDTLQLRQLSFQTAHAGMLTASGSVRLDPTQGFPLDLRVAARRALLVNRPDLIATVSSDISIAGSTTAGLDVSGPITVDRADIRIDAPTPASFPTIAVREINVPGVPNPPTEAVPVALDTPSSDAVPIRLALTVRAPQAIFVRGRGLDAEVGGQLQVTGTAAAPIVLGNLSLRRGDFTLVGRRLTFTRGDVSLTDANAIDPLLDFQATTSVGSTAIEITITGTPRTPKIELSSSPALPQSEVMALLLFGKTSANLSPFELIQAAQSLAELTGHQSPGAGVLGRVRSDLGLDRLSIDSSGQNAGETTIDAGRYVAPGIYVGAKQGASATSSRGVVEIEVFKHTKIEGDVGADSQGRVGVKMEWDY